MGSVFSKLRLLGPAAFVAKAIFVALAVDALLLAFILLRRAYRKHYFSKRDAHVFFYRQRWNALISGEIPYKTWRKKAFDRGVIETMALDALEAAGPQDAAKLLKFLRTSGLIEKRIFEARELRGWRRMRALVALGRTRAPEGITALAEGLRDRDVETRLAALRGLGRVLGEVANPSLGLDLMQFVGDDLDELRAAAARAMSHVQPALAFDVLNELAEDPIWFVRLRAIVSLGTLSDPRALPVLLRGLTDSNRIVRLRAAESLIRLRGAIGLATFKDEKRGQPTAVDDVERLGLVSIFEQVAALKDRYGLHAYLTALENANLRGKLEEEIHRSVDLAPQMKRCLQEVLQTGQPPAEPVVDENVTVKAEPLP